MNAATVSESDSPPATARLSVLIRDLHYRYPDGRHALRGVSLEARTGESIALVGPNGAGKSTLLWHLNGLLPGRATRDHSHSHGIAAKRPAAPPSVWIDGLEVNDANGPEVRRRVGLLFQDPDDQLFAPTVLEDVAFGPLNLGLSAAEARRIALDSLARVDLADAAHRPPHHLSFGERKRACLAGVLACSPTVLVLDEPSANLDPRARRRLITLIRDLPATKIVATHDLELALDLCPRAILLDQGTIRAEGPTPAILADADLLDAHGLEVPLSLTTRPARALPPDPPIDA